MKKTIYRVSLVLNLVFLLLAAIVLVKKFDSIKYRLEKATDKSVFVINSDIRGAYAEQFDNIPYLTKKERITKKNAKSDFSLLVIGNSLALHEKNEAIGWNHESGMVASSLKHDYVHLLAKKISNARNTNINVTIINAAEFERNIKSVNLSRFEETEEPFDAVIVQLGENISDYDLTIYENSIVENISQLFSLYNADVKIICLPFWFSAKENEIFTKIAIDNNLYICDLSHIGMVADSFASYDVKYENEGIGKHPGNKGMERISEAMFSVIQAASK